MMQDNYENEYIDTDECSSRGACSIAPNIAALQELTFFFLKQTANYIIKLEKLGAINKSIKYNIINDIAALVSINEFSEEQLFSIVMNNYFLMKDTQKAYIEICGKKNINPQILKTKLSFDNTTTISKAISQGEKIFLSNYQKYSATQKNLIEILYIVIKSTSLNLIKLNDFKEFNDLIYQEILKALDILNSKNQSNKKIQEEINNLAIMGYKAELRISQILHEKFGGIEKVELSHSSRKGKAILISGTNFLELKEILERTKNQDIDIYTHADLMIAHSLKEFNKYKHLVGHYGDSTENTIRDFSTFPGAILLTKNSRKNSEYLYRGRLFSNDYIIPKGVIKITDNDYTELINAATEAKGFSKGKTKPGTILGYSEDNINNQIEEISQKLKNNKIKRLLIIGVNMYSKIQKNYFRDILLKLEKDEYAITFTTDYKKDNVLTINTGNYTPIATSILNKLFEKYPVSDDKIFFFFTQCDVSTISNIITLNYYNAKNIYMADCPPTIINPSVLKTFKKEYKIKTTTSATRDLRNIRKQ